MCEGSLRMISHTFFVKYHCSFLCSFLIQHQKWIQHEGKVEVLPFIFANVFESTSGFSQKNAVCEIHPYSSLLWLFPLDIGNTQINLRWSAT